MTSMIYLPAAATCSGCSFTTTDVHLLARHSCDVAKGGGRCEDFPCCGHERGDCNGELYGSDEAIKSDPHLLCDHNTGDCSVWDEMQNELEDADDEVEAPRKPIGTAAVCRDCGEEFVIVDDDDVDEAAGTAVHYQTADEVDCDGIGDIIGSWSAR